jgi:lipopolysaccharide/colanic/teichoic acid biosynthesis glycosyltransferase
MSVPEPGPGLSAVEGTGPDGFGDEAADEERGRRNRSSWPTTSPTAWAMTALVALAVSAPFVIHNLSSALMPVLVVPAVLATLAGRLAFESVDGSSVRVISALAGSAAGVVIMGGAALILGLRADLAVVLVALALGALTLSGAGLVRDLEVRVRLGLRRVFFAGSPESLRELRRELTQSHEASLVGAVPAHSPLTADALIAAMQSARATVLVLDTAAAVSPTIISAAGTLSEHGVRIRDLLGYYEAEFKKVPLTELTPAWFLFEREQARQTTVADTLRRLTMTFAAGAMLLACLPLLTMLALAIRLTSPGPAIFRQTRVGKDGARFTLVKLRTMTITDPQTGSDEADAVWATDLAHRITPLGRFLRRYRLDELPQLWNVMRGELALIGPRPEQVPIVERLQREIPHYGARHTVRPGLTGWAQVNLGYAGSLAGARAKLQRDLYYVKHRSLRLDLLILWLTVKAVFSDPG